MWADKNDIIDAVVKGNDVKFIYDKGYDSFKFPFTVSFYEHGSYIVVIDGKTAIVEKIESKGDEQNG